MNTKKMASMSNLSLIGATNPGAFVEEDGKVMTEFGCIEEEKSDNYKNSSNENNPNSHNKNNEQEKICNSADEVGGVQDRKPDLRQREDRRIYRGRIL